MKRITTVFLFIALMGLAACKKPPSPEKLAKLQGGTTTVVVYGFCIPVAHLFQTTLTRHTLTYAVNGKAMGTMKSCSFRTFRVPSGYWDARFTGGGNLFGHGVPGQIYHPGKTQYLHMYAAGNNSFTGRWVSKAEAQQGIAEIKKIGQLY
jgi:hypothetical protein